MNMILDVRPYGIDKLIDVSSISEIDLQDGADVVLVAAGKEIKVNFRTKENLQDALDLITNGQVKL